MKIKIFYYIFLVLFFSCQKDKLKIQSIDNENFVIKIFSQDTTPLYQKVYDKKTNELVGLDSVKNDTLYSYIQGKLVSKGLWKYSENGQIIFKNWAITFDSELNVINLTEYGDFFDPNAQFRSINQIYFIKEGIIDTAESVFYSLKKNKKGELSLFLKPRVKENMLRKSFLFEYDTITKNLNRVDLNEKLNILNFDSLYPEKNYEIMTFYRDSEKDTFDFLNSSTITISSLDYFPSHVLKRYAQDALKHE